MFNFQSIYDKKKIMFKERGLVNEALQISPADWEFNFITSILNALLDNIQKAESLL